MFVACGKAWLGQLTDKIREWERENGSAGMRENIWITWSGDSVAWAPFARQFFIFTASSIACQFCSSEKFHFHFHGNCKRVNYKNLFEFFSVASEYTIRKILIETVATVLELCVSFCAKMPIFYQREIAKKIFRWKVFITSFFEMANFRPIGDHLALKLHDWLGSSPN